MISRLALVAAAALVAAPALAASPAHDDTTYPQPAPTWAGSPDTTAGALTDSADVSYRGAHAAIVKRLPARPAGAVAVALADDTTYPAVDPAAPPAASSARSAPAVEHLACGCARR